MLKTISLSKPLPKQNFNASFSAFGLRDARLDPFINVDLFSMSAPTFPPHPHAGFSAVTYMLPASTGAFSNRDSLGASNTIEPGDTHWTQAGSGMMHEEIPTIAGVNCVGFQIFVKLSQEHELITPRAFHLAAKDTPKVSGDGWNAQLVTGSLNGNDGGLQGLCHDVLLADISIKAEATVKLRVPDGFGAWAVVISGEIASGTQRAQANSAIFWDVSGDTIIIDGGSDGANILLGGGKPLGERFTLEGPFALCSRERLIEAKRRYSSGRMGALEPSF